MLNSKGIVEKNRTEMSIVAGNILGVYAGCDRC